MLQISDRFASQCSPVISSNYDTTGTVTLAKIDHLSVTDLNALFTPGGLFADLDAWFKHSIEMKACGVRRYALYDWIMANAERTEFRKAVSGTRAVGTDSLLHPFIMGRQESVVNRDHWKMVNGVAGSAYTGGAPTTAVATMSTGPISVAAKDAALVIDANARIIRVQSRHGIPMEANWFRERESIHVFGRAADGGSQHGQWRVLTAASSTDLTYLDVMVTSVNEGSTERFSSTPGASATKGVIIPGVNNVNDYEKWCQNLPTIDPRKRVPFWVQTYRSGRTIDSFYRDVYKRLYSSNPAFREFGDLPLAERNRQDELEMQKRFVNEFFYNKPISVNQTLALWESLESIESVSGNVLYPTADTNGLGGKLVGKRANFIGVREQLRTCDRLFDLTNQPLNLYEFLQLNYDMVRARQTLGRRVKHIDWFTSSTFRELFHTAYVNYIDKELKGLARFPIELGAMNNLDMTYDGYYFKRPAGVKINLISDEFFDDFLDELDDSGIASRGNLLLALDIGKKGAGTIYWAMIAAKRRVYKTAEIEELARIDSSYRCVMDVPSIEQTLFSHTGTAIVECPLTSAWLENFSSDVPSTAGKVTPYTNLY